MARRGAQRGEGRHPRPAGRRVPARPACARAAARRRPSRPCGRGRATSRRGRLVRRPERFHVRAARARSDAARRRWTLVCQDEVLRRDVAVPDAREPVCGGGRDRSGGARARGGARPPGSPGPRAHQHRYSPCVHRRPWRVCRSRAGVSHRALDQLRRVPPRARQPRIAVGRLRRPRRRARSLCAGGRSRAVARHSGIRPLDAAGGRAPRLQGGPVGRRRRGRGALPGDDGGGPLPRVGRPDDTRRDPRGSRRPGRRLGRVRTGRRVRAKREGPPEPVPHTCRALAPSRRGRAGRTRRSRSSPS